MVLLVGVVFLVIMIIHKMRELPLNGSLTVSLHSGEDTAPNIFLNNFASQKGKCGLYELIGLSYDDKVIQKYKEILNRVGNKFYSKIKFEKKKKGDRELTVWIPSPPSGWKLTFGGQEFNKKITGSIRQANTSVIARNMDGNGSIELGLSYTEEDSDRESKFEFC